MRIEPSHALQQPARSIEGMEAAEAEEITRELAPAPERGRLIQTSKARFGCSSVVYQEYERVRIAVATRCWLPSGAISSVKISWKEAACEQIDNEGHGAEVARSSEF
ncbi:MAG TPA: hypothetical protein VE842_10195, partial [Pyrinomonadaceae bacterium]|nr:hypothetical protein [Pyrinomonadaceae bacterium]